MATRSQPAAPPRLAPLAMPNAIWWIIAWQALVGAAALVGAVSIWNAEFDFNLAPIIKGFAALVVTLFGTASLASAWLMFRVDNNGRIMSMFINLTGAVLSVLVLLHVLGVYVGLDAAAEALYQHIGWLLGIAAGYAVYWIGGRFADETQARLIVERLGLGVLLLSLMILLLVAGLPAALLSMLGALVTPAGLALLALALVFAFTGLYIMRQGMAFGETILAREAWQGWLFLMPNFISFAIFFALPLLLSFYLSFTDYGETSLTSANWVGVRNYSQILSLEFRGLPSADASTAGVFTPGYTEILRIGTLSVGAADGLFWQSLFTTIRYCILLLTLSIPPALLLALVLNSKVPGMKFFRAVYFLPSIAAVVGVALIWRWLYNPVIGYINYAVAGLSNLFGQPDPQVQWLTDDNVLLLAVVIMAAWQVIGFNAVIFLAGLQGINKEVMEAATVDGAGAWTRFRSIMLPLLAPTTFFVTVTTLIAGLQAFNEFYALLTSSTSNARLTTVFYLYLKGFRDIRFGYASSTAWILFVIIFAVTLIQFRLSSRAEAYQD